jgi:hypothetical protein
LGGEIQKYFEHEAFESKESGDLEEEYIGF